jgi:hypothetical protein
MEIEIEMTTESTDMSEIIQKLSPILSSAKEQGFTVNELEIEREEEEDEEDEQKF